MKARNVLIALQLAALAFLSAPVNPAGAAATPTPRGGEIRVDTDTQASHYKPTAAAFQDGSFVVAWTSDGEIRARFLDSRGRPTSAEVTLKMGGVVGIVDQVVADRDGSFLVVATGATAARPSDGDVYMRRFNRNGTPKGKVIRANLPSDLYRSEGVATIGPDGRIAVAWRSIVDYPGEPGGHANAVARIFSAKGKPLTPEITLKEGEPSSPAGDDAHNALPKSLALAPDGTLSAMIQDYGSGCQDSHLARVPPGGTSASLQNLSLPGCIPSYLTDGSLAMGLDGSLVAAWSQFDVQARRFSPNGTPRGDVFSVSQEPADYFQIDPAVALQAGGSFVVVWTDLEDRDGDGKGIFGRAFAPNGTPRSGDFRVNVTTTGDQEEPAIAASRRGNVLVVWSQWSQTDDGGQSGIFARVLSADR